VTILCVSQVLVLKELANHAPTFFFQQVQQFFDSIFNAVRDPKVSTYFLLCTLKFCSILLTSMERHYSIVDVLSKEQVFLTFFRSLFSSRELPSPSRNVTEYR